MLCYTICIRDKPRRKLMASSNVTKITVNLPTQLVEFLQEEADREQVPVTTVIRRAIKMEQFWVANERANKKILIEDNGNIRELIRQ